MRHIVFPYLSHKERDIIFCMYLYHKGRDVQILSFVLSLISNLTEKNLFSLGRTFALTLILLTWRMWWAPNNASRWQMGFNSAFKGLNTTPRLILVNNVNIKFHKNLPSGNRVSLCRQTDRQTDITRLVFAVRFAKMSKINFLVSLSFIQNQIFSTSSAVARDSSPL